MTKKANACVNELPIPIISGAETKYVAVGTAMNFDGSGSYDPDITPNITKWWWNIYYVGEYYAEYVSGELPTPTVMLQTELDKSYTSRLRLWY